MKFYEKPDFKTTAFDATDIITDSTAIDDIIDDKATTKDVTVNFDELNL